MLRKKKERKTGYSRLSCLLTDPYTPNPTSPSHPTLNPTIKKRFYPSVHCIPNPSAIPPSSVA